VNHPTLSRRSRSRSRLKPTRQARDKNYKRSGAVPVLCTTFFPPNCPRQAVRLQQESPFPSRQRQAGGAAGRDAKNAAILVAPDPRWAADELTMMGNVAGSARRVCFLVLQNGVLQAMCSMQSNSFGCTHSRQCSTISL